MRTMFLSALSAAAMAAPLCAQYDGEGPGMVVPQATYPKIGPALGNTITGVAQVHLAPVSATGRYMCLSVYTSASPSATKVMAGAWDTVTEVFTKNTDVDHFTGGTSGPFALSVSRDLLTAVYDHGTAQPQWATRANVGVPFGAPAPINGVPAGYIDVNLTSIKGQLTLLYVSGQDIYAGDFAAGNVTNSRKVITNPPGNSNVHSPAPIEDSTGNCRSLHFSVLVGGNDSDPMFTANIDDSAPKRKMWDDANWKNNGDADGGTFIDAIYSAGYTNAIKWGMIAISDATWPTLGGPVKLVSFAPTHTAAIPHAAFIAFSPAIATAGTPIPGVGGSPLGLSLSGLVVVGTGTFDKSSGLNEITINAPASPFLGASLYTQAIMADLNTGTPYLGNTAAITIK